jgi:nucleoside-diphosphate-sugar epimerase
MQKILLTGATGFIGSWFLNEAHKKNIEVFAFRAPASKPKINLDLQPVWLEAPYEKFSKIKLPKVDALIHLGAHSANVPYDTLERCIYWNVVKVIELFQSAKAQGVEKFLITGTSFEYGLSADLYDKVPTTAALRPTKTYPVSKAMAYLALHQWAHDEKIKLHYTRLFQVYGAGESPNRLYPSLLRAAKHGDDLKLSAGDQIRDFIHVSDVVARLISALEFVDVEYGSPKVSNLGTGKGTSVREFANKIWSEQNAKGKLSFGAIPYREQEIMRLVAGEI